MVSDKQITDQEYQAIRGLLTETENILRRAAFLRETARPITRADVTYGDLQRALEVVSQIDWRDVKPLKAKAK